MRALALVLTVVVLGSCSRTVRPWTPVGSVPRTLQLDNGLTIKLYPVPHVPVVRVNVTVQAGWADDPADRTGMSSLALELMHEASAAPSQASLGARIAGVTLWNDGATETNRTAFGAIALPERLDEVLAIQAARLNLDCKTVDPAALDRAIAVAGARARTELELAYGAAIAALGAATYGTDHPYARDPSQVNFDDLAPAAVCDYLRSRWGADRVQVEVLGSFDLARAEQTVRALFDGMPRSTAARDQPQARLGEARDELVANLEDSVVVVSLPAPANAGLATSVASTLSAAAQDLVDGQRVPRAMAFALGEASMGRLAITATVSDPSAIDAVVEDIYASMQQAIEDTAAVVANRAKAKQRATASATSWQYVAGFSVFGRSAFVWDPDQWKDELEASSRWMTAHLSRTQAHVSIIRPNGASSPARVAVFQLAVARVGFDRDEHARPAHLEIPAAPLLSIDESRLRNGLRVFVVPLRGVPIATAMMTFPVGELTHPGAWWAPLALGGIDLEVFGEASDRTTHFGASGPIDQLDGTVWRLWAALRRDNEAERRPASVPNEPATVTATKRRRCFSSAMDGAHVHVRALLRRATRPPRSDGSALRRGHYAPRNGTLVIAGDVDERAARRLASSWFGGRGGLALPPPQEVVRDVTPAWEVILDDAAERVQIAMGFVTQSDPAADRAARMVLAELVHGAYGLSLGWMENDASIVVTRMSTSGAVADVLDLLAELETARTAPVELERARQAALLEVLAVGADSTRAADAVAFLATSGESIDYYDRLARAIVDTTSEEVARVAKLDLDPDRMVVAIRGPGSVAEAGVIAAGARPEAIEWTQGRTCP
jgi:predicted Zn-dependent peptidase